MTECNIPTSEKWCTKGLKPGSVGMAAPGVSLKIVDAKTREILGPYQQGEICVRGPVVMKGYNGIDPSTYLDDQGFLVTGDLGYYDEDEYFFIVGRIKEMLSYDGYEHPDVPEACVVGKPAGDWGEEPAAFVVRAPGARVAEQQLVDYVANKVSTYMQLRGGVTSPLRDPRGKLLRSQLKQNDLRINTR